jgi:hypothetical protein
MKIGSSVMIKRYEFSRSEVLYDEKDEEPVPSPMGDQYIAAGIDDTAESEEVIDALIKLMNDLKTNEAFDFEFRKVYCVNTDASAKVFIPMIIFNSRAWYFVNGMILAAQSSIK